MHAGPRWYERRGPLVVVVALVLLPMLLLTLLDARRADEATEVQVQQTADAAASAVSAWVEQRVRDQRAVLFEMVNGRVRGAPGGAQAAVDEALDDVDGSFALFVAGDGRLLAASPERAELPAGTDLSGRFSHVDAVLAGAPAATWASDAAVTGSGVVLALVVGTGAGEPMLSTAIDPGAGLLDDLLVAAVETLPGASAVVVEPTTGVVLLGEQDGAERGGEVVVREAGDGLLRVELFVPAGSAAPGAGVAGLGPLALLLLAGLGTAVVVLTPRVAGVTRDLRDEAARVATYFDGSQTASLLVDEHLQVVRANPAMVALSGWSDHELRGADAVTSLLHPDDVDGDTVRDLVLSLAGNDTVRRAEWSQRWFDRSGQERAGRLSGVAVRGASGLPMGILLELVDLTDEHAALEDLARSHRALDRLGSQLAHDIISPLTATRGLAQLLGEHDLPEETRRDFAQRIGRSTDRIVDLVRAIYEEARRTDEPDWTTVDVGELATWLEELMATNLAASGGRLLVEATHREVEVPAQLLRTVLANLLENALKHHVPGRAPVVVLRRVVDPGRTHVVLEDNGLGVPPEALEDIFTDGRRGHDALVDGRGTGLATCRRMVEAAGGRIWAELTPTGGLAVHVHLPLPPIGDRAVRSGVTVVPDRRALPRRDRTGTRRG